MALTARTSAIDPTLPTAGNATTQSVRDNFAAAEGELNDIFQHEVDEAARVDTAAATETARVNLQFTTEQTRVNTELDTKAMRAGDLGGTVALTTVTRIQGHPVSTATPPTTAGSVAAGAPANPPNQVLGWSGAQWEPQNVLQVGGRPVNPVTPAAGQALIWSGTAWQPTTGTGSPENIVFRTMTPDIHNWISATEGVFAGEGTNITNAPSTARWQYLAISSAANNTITLLAINPTNQTRLLQKRYNGTVWSDWSEYLSLDGPAFYQRVRQIFGGPANMANMFTADWDSDSTPSAWSLESGTGATAVYRYNSATASQWWDLSIGLHLTNNVVGQWYRLTFETTGTFTAGSFSMSVDVGLGDWDGWTQTQTGTVPGTHTVIYVRPRADYRWLTFWAFGVGNFTLRLVEVRTANEAATFNLNGVEIRLKDGDNISIGSSAGLSLNDYEASYNLAIGGQALMRGANSYMNQALGYAALMTLAQGSYNVAVGGYALRFTNASNFNVGVGYEAAQSNTTGQSNTACGPYALRGNTTGSNNTGVGHNAMHAATTGSGNVAVGFNAGRYAGASTTAMTVANNSTFIGRDSGGAAATGQDNLTVIGNGARATQNTNQIVLGNATINSIRAQVAVTTPLSDVRIKEDIQPADLELCLAAVKALPIKRYSLNETLMGERPDRHVTGFIADDVERIFPKSVSTCDERFPDGTFIKDCKSLTNDQALPTLWGATQRLTQKIEELERELAELREKYDG